VAHIVRGKKTESSKKRRIKKHKREFQEKTRNTKVETNVKTRRGSRRPLPPPPIGRAQQR
jgi:hypothetical protein